MGNSIRRPSPEGHHRKDDSLMGVPRIKKEVGGGCQTKNSSINIESLPEDLLYDILLHLGAQDIYKRAIFVCKKWHNIIHNSKFIYEHLRNSTPGLVIHYYRQREYTSFLTMRRGKIEISKFSNYDCKYELLASCNGLLLECDRDKYLSYYIANPSTNICLSLPPKYYSGIGYASASMVYKVVNPYCHNIRNPDELGCSIYTIGVDKSRRHVQIQHLSFAARKVLISNPLTTQGFIHWTKEKSAHVVTLNVETEVITQIHLPQGYGERLKYYLSTGSSLTFLTNIKEYSWEVWELRQETGEWMKLPNIDLEPQEGKIGILHGLSDPLLIPPNCTNVTFKPVGWLNCREALVLHAFPTLICVVYNVRTRQIEFFELGHGFDCYKFIVHRNSLVGFDGC